MLEISSESGEEYKPFTKDEKSDTRINCKQGVPETDQSKSKKSFNDLISSVSEEECKSLNEDESCDLGMNSKQDVPDTSESSKLSQPTVVNQTSKVQKWKFSRKETSESKAEKVLKYKKPKEVLCATCRYKCAENFSEEYRQRICMEFWNLNYNGQKEFLISRVKNNKAQCRRVRTGSRPPKSCSRSYYFLLDQKEIRVCKSFFLKTLGISHGPVETALSGIKEDGTFFNPDRRGKKSRKEDSDKVTKNLNKHIESSQNTESHYSTKNSEIKYLDPNLPMSQMFDVNMYVKCMFDPE